MNDYTKTGIPPAGKKPHWWNFKVRSLNTAELDQAARKLAVMAYDFDPTLIVGIRSGGYTVASLVAKYIPTATLTGITCARPSTKNKQASGIKAMLAALPHIITNPLRIFEHVVLTQLRSPAHDVELPHPDELNGVKEGMQTQVGHARVLIVDDAVDSGATLSAVSKAVQGIMEPGATMKVAAITVTTAEPLVEPDFTLYRYVLCRFPWSLDAKE